MKLSATGLFRRDGLFVTLDVLKTDGYNMTVAKKASEVLGIEGNEKDLRLFRTRGALLPVTEDWTVAKHKRKIRVGPDLIQLGVAPVVGYPKAEV